MSGWRLTWRAENSTIQKLDISRPDFRVVFNVRIHYLSGLDCWSLWFNLTVRRSNTRRQSSERTTIFTKSVLWILDCYLPAWVVDVFLFTVQVWTVNFGIFWGLRRITMWIAFTFVAEQKPEGRVNPQDYKNTVIAGSACFWYWGDAVLNLTNGTILRNCKEQRLQPDPGFNRAGIQICLFFFSTVPRIHRHQSMWR